MSANHVLLQRIELTATTSSVTFKDIPQTGYTDLKVVFSARSNSAFAFDRGSVTFNGVTSGYSWRGFAADGTTAGSSNYSNQTSLFNVSPSVNGGTATASVFGNAEIFIPDYTSSKAKSAFLEFVMDNMSSTAFFLGFDAGLTTITNPVKSITIAPTLGSLVVGSSFSLYGIASVDSSSQMGPKASGGDIIVNDGEYWYHAFLTTGAFKPKTSLTCDMLVVAGGGGGGHNAGGGGGAGGLLGFTSVPLTNSSYTCTVGAGGAAGIGNGVVGYTGGTSQFGSFTVVAGGGGGGSIFTYNGIAGGSGGGGASGYESATGGTGGSATSGQGYAGGTGANGAGTSGTNWGAGGGGGAGAVGTAGTTSAAGNGGIGTLNYSSWARVTNTGDNGYFAGGGAGGKGVVSAATGGAGGGGSSTSSTNSGVANTGGGGAGANNGNPGGTAGSGGSGIIIIRYAMV